MADVVVVHEAASATANSYASVAEAQAYHDSHPYPEAWDEADPGQQSRALVTATRMLDTWYEWYGSISTLSQALLWPRRGVLRPGISESQPPSVGNEWHEPYAVFLSSTEVPVIIKNATAELARTLLVSDRTADSDIETQGLTSLTAGPVSMEFKASVAAKPIPDAVAVLASQLGRPRSKTGAGATTMYRG